MNRLGIFGDFSTHVTNETSHFGADYAINDALEACMRYGKHNQTTIYYEDFRNPYDLTSLYLKKVIRETNSLSKAVFMDSELFPKDRSIEIMHTPCSSYSLLVDARDELFNQRIPITSTVHCISRSLIDPYFVFDSLANLREYDAIICTSQAAKSAYTNTLRILEKRINHISNDSISLNRNVVSIPLGYKADEFYPGNRLLARKELDLPPEAYIFLYFGRLSPLDKADLVPLLLAFKPISEAYDNAILIIAGNSSTSYNYVDELEYYIRNLTLKNRVVVLSPFESSKRRTLYQASNVFVSPIDNIQETYGLTPIEAMACGIPQIVSDWSGYKDTVIHEVTGFRVPTYMLNDGDFTEAQNYLPANEWKRYLFQSRTNSINCIVDIEKLRYYMNEMITNNALYEQMVNASIETAIQFRWSRIIDRYEDLWDELLNIASFSAKREKSADRISYRDIWGAYPTEFIDSSVNLYLEERNTYILDSFYAKNFYTHSVIDIQLIAQIVNALHTPQSIESLNRTLQISKSMLVRTIALLWKYGILRIGDNGNAY